MLENHQLDGTEFIVTELRLHKAGPNSDGLPLEVFQHGVRLSEESVNYSIR